MSPHPISMFCKAINVNLKYLQTNPVRCVEDACFHSGEIRDILHKADMHYTQGTPFLQDEKYDKLVNYLENLTGKSYTKIGDAPRPNQKKVVLPIHTGSLNKVKTLRQWKNWAKHHEGPYVLSDKLDGISLVVEFRPRGLPRVFTRGDGTIGCNVNDIARFAIKTYNPNKLTYVRGELIFSKKKWASLCKWKPGYANARNAVAGLANQIANGTNGTNVSDETVKMLGALDFVVFSVTRQGEKLTKSQQLALAWTAGFKTVWNCEVEQIEFEKLGDELARRKMESAFAIDGLVICDNKNYPPTKQGNPKHAIAFKMDQESQIRETIVTNVFWNLSRYGLMKPVAKVSPVVIDGVVISKVTLYNARWVKNNGIGIGSKVQIIRSGDVIPKIHSVLENVANSPPATPEGEDGIQWRWKDEIDIELIGESPDVKARKLESFASKLNIAGLKIGTSTKLVRAGINTIPKFCTATGDMLSGINGLGPTSAKKIITARDKALEIHSVLEVVAACDAFGQGFGMKKMKPFFDAFPNIQGYQDLDITEIERLPGWSKKSSIKLIKSIPRAVAMARELIAIGTVGTKRNVTDGPKLTVVLSGFRDKSAQQDMEKLGVAFQNAVTKKCDYLVMKPGSKATSKSQKARKFGIAVISMEKLIEIASNVTTT